MPSNLFSQIFDGSKNVITTSANGARSVYAVDLDGDGDIDVLSAASYDNTIAWYENDGSQGFTKIDITTSANGALSVYAADVDGDGDMDVLSASYQDNTIAWYKNDGGENFTKIDITTSANGAASVYAEDIDGDGDMDVLSASESDDTIAWYENDGSQGFTKIDITTSVNGAASVYAEDIDGDGDMDVLSAASYEHTIAWYENDGSQGFTKIDITTSANGALSVYAADVDGDGDMDVLSASSGDNTIAWYKNDGGEIFTENVITTAADGAFSVFAEDVDGDGDIDVLSASLHDDTIAWYKKDAGENFIKIDIATSANGARSVYAVDLDGDGDIDVLSASLHDDTIAWYENTSTCGSSYDCAGECGGSSTEDCAGECGGSAEEDECGVCGGDGYVANCVDNAGGSDCVQMDCSGECGGSAVYQEYFADYDSDSFGSVSQGTFCSHIDTDGDPTNDNAATNPAVSYYVTNSVDTDDDCDTDLYDDCGICTGSGAGGMPYNGQNTTSNCSGPQWNASQCTVMDCAGVCGGSAVLTDCGCGEVASDATTGCCADGLGPNDDAQDCAGVCGGNLVEDECGVCGGNNSSCTDCNGDVNGAADYDNCSTCVGGDTGLTACILDCAGVWGGNLVEDECGVCGGNNSSCTDCNGDVNGAADYDNCSTCVGGDTGLTACVQDCAGEWGGTSNEDNCGVCGGDNSSCTDCNGDVNGAADYDNCSICVGGDTGLTACIQDCAGTWGGGLVDDECGVCGGNGPPENYNCAGQCTAGVDCNGECGGTALEDVCGICEGTITNVADCPACPDGGSVCLEFGDIDSTEGTMEILYSSVNPIYGFQFDISDIEILDGASDIGVVYTQPNSTLVIGINFDGTPLPSGSGVLVTLTFTPSAVEIDSSCLSNAVVGAFGGVEYPVSIDDCALIPGCSVDCAGECGGTAVEDNCSTCDSDPSNDCEQDCAGTWGGGLVDDDCGVCGGDNTPNTGICDCAGVPNGSAVVDNCGTCDSNSGNDCVEDCNGVSGGSDVFDNCNVCDSDPSNDCEQDCAGTWGGGLVDDECGICGGTGAFSYCIDTDGDGQGAGDSTYYCLADLADLPTGWVEDCSDLEPDCMTNDTDCAGNCGGSDLVDCTGVCNGIAVVDCYGVCGGLAVVDECGVCGGPGIDNCGGCDWTNECYGCTDPDAHNYEEYNTIDDDSCIFGPDIISIYDAPQDQGGYVFLNWSKNTLDLLPDNFITHYSIYRHLPNERGWEYLDEVPAIGLESYGYVAPTIYTSPSDSSEIFYTFYLVNAHFEGDLYASAPDSSYSFDNLSPSVPDSVFAFAGYSNGITVNLSWNEPVDEDFQYFSVFRDGELVNYMIENTYSDSPNSQNNEVAYHVTATDIHGNESEPSETITVPLTVNQTIQTGIGWNWFSINVQSEDMSVNNVLSNLDPIMGDFIKSQEGSAEYYAEFGWFGSLESINIIDMYQLDIENGGTIAFTGYPADPSSTAIHLTDGWNWIGYVPQNAGIINDALGSIGDSGVFIKNQAASAEYYDEFGWFGSLDYMAPGDGYQLQIIGEADLIYPNFEADDGLTRTKEVKVLPASISEWVVNPHAYEFNGAITLSVDNRADSPGDYIAAFVDDECRGIAERMDFPFDNVDRGIYILMAYSNLEQEEEFTFKYYNGAEEEVLEYTESLEFTLDMVVGNGFKPFGLSREFIIPTEFSLSAAYPNPFNPVTTLSFAIPIDSEVSVSVYNLQGREVSTLIDANMDAGYHSIVWDANSYASGVYFVKMIAGEFISTQKLMLVK